MNETSKIPLSRLLLAGSLLIVAAASLIFFLQTLPVDGTLFGFDWYGIWLRLQGGLPSYGAGLQNPPWSLIPVLPLGLLPFKTSWAILTLATLTVLVISVPRKASNKLDVPVTIFLVTSFPSLRNIADGNLEFLPIAGVFLTIYAYRTRKPWLLAFGFLLASAKPQETWLYMAMLSWFVFRTWPKKRFLPAAIGLVLIITVSTLLYGKEWVAAMFGMVSQGGITDICLLATMSRLQVPAMITWGIWIVILGITLHIAFSTGHIVDRCKAGLLTSASILLAPYASGLNSLTIIAIGVVPQFRSDLKSAMALGILINLPYLMAGRSDIMNLYGANYATVVLLLAWGMLAWKTRKGAETPLAA